MQTTNLDISPISRLPKEYKHTDLIPDRQSSSTVREIRSRLSLPNSELTLPRACLGRDTLSIRPRRY